MNSDKPSPADTGKRDARTELDSDAIPTLEEPFDPASEYATHPPVLENSMDLRPGTKGASDTESDMEPSIDLGYANGVHDSNETDDLAEMEEIHTLPLAEMVLDESSGGEDARDLSNLASAEQKRQIATLEAIVFDGDDPNAPAPKYARPAAPEMEPAPLPTAESYTPASAGGTPAPPPPEVPPLTKPLPKKSENPFLPQHILDRLNQGKRNLVEEIAQSSAALDASTAILRTHARADRLSRPAYGESKPQQQHYSFNRDKSSQQKQKLVDDLVEEYLPLIAAELRRRLRKILDE